MESIKKSVVRRIIIFFCCTVVFITSVFMSYDNTLVVKAVDDTDLLKDAAIVCLSCLGLVLSGPTAGAVVSILGPEMLALGTDVHDYVTQNEEDGTTTISQDFVLLVLDAYNQYRGEHYFDGTYEEDPTNKYFKYDAFSISLISANGHSFTYRVSDFTNICQLAFLKTYDGPVDTNIMFYTFIYLNGKVTTINMLGTNMGYGVKPVITSENKGFAGSVQSSYPGFSLNDGSHISFQTDCSSIPIFESQAAMEAFLKGEGDASNAINYRNLSGCESSSFSGKYSGGDINVSTEKLNGIQDKLDEINETDKSIDDKLKDLLEWLGIGDGTGGGVGGSWYDKVLDYLDKILKQLKSIKHWTIVDTVIDGVDAIADWLDLIHDVLSDVDNGAESAVSTLSSALGDSMNLMKKKFPFSIPWDILFFISVLSAEPEIPQFSIPFDIEISALDLQFHYDMELDFTPFQWLSDLSRLLLSMTYAVGLMKMTFDVSNVNKEG